MGKGARNRAFRKLARASEGHGSAHSPKTIARAMRRRGRWPLGKRRVQR